MIHVPEWLLKSPEVMQEGAMFTARVVGYTEVVLLQKVGKNSYSLFVRNNDTQNWHDRDTVTMDRITEVIELKEPQEIAA